MYIVVRMEGKHNMGCGCVHVLECVCMCMQILVIEYEDVLKVGTICMSPPATCTSKTSCSLCCGDVAREVGYVCVY